jgi:lysophospholipase L1-like esterase
MILSVCATLTLLEIGIRIAKPQDLEYWDSDGFRRIQSTIPHYAENIPHGHGNFIGVPVSINAYGMRGAEISIPKPAGVFRIVVVGDSITFGYGIPVESTYVKVLEGLLNRNTSGDRQYEVLNGGALGGSLSDYEHFLTEKAAKLQPDMILVGLCLNDILVYSDSGAVSEAGAEWEGQRLTGTRRLSRFLLRNSQLYAFSYTQLKAAMYSARIIDVNKERGGAFVTLTAPTTYQNEAWESSLRKLTKIIEFCRERGYRIGLVVFPMQMQLSDAELQFYHDKYHLRLGPEALSGEPQRRLQEFATRMNLAMVDLLPVYRASNPEELYLRNKMIRADPTHPSVKGNRIAAEEIVRVFKPLLEDSQANPTERQTVNHRTGQR